HKTYTLSLHDALPILEMKNFIIWMERYLIQSRRHFIRMKERRTTWQMIPRKRKNCLKHPITMEKKLSSCLQIIMMNMKKSARLRSEEHTSELQSRFDL